MTRKRSGMPPRALGRKLQMNHRILLKGARAGNPYAFIELGHKFYAGQFFRRDLKRAAHYFTQAASKANPDSETRLEGRFMLALMNIRGETAVRNDRQAAATFAWVGKQSDHPRSPSSLKILADIYLGGAEGIAPNGHKAVACLERIAREPYGGLVIGSMLGRIYLEGQAGIPKDVEKAKAWLKPAAEAGNSDALYVSGVMHLTGQGFPANLREGTNLIGKAAEKEHPTATRHLLNLLHEHDDVKRWYAVNNLRYVQDYGALNFDIG
jgi:TPR repeat protein